MENAQLLDLKQLLESKKVKLQELKGSKMLLLSCISDARLKGLSSNLNRRIEENDLDIILTSNEIIYIKKHLKDNGYEN